MRRVDLAVHKIGRACRRNLINHTLMLLIFNQLFILGLFWVLYLRAQNAPTTVSIVYREYQVVVEFHKAKDHQTNEVRKTQLKIYMFNKYTLTQGDDKPSLKCC